MDICSLFPVCTLPYSIAYMTLSSYFAHRYQRRTFYAASQRVLPTLSKQNRLRMLAKVRAMWIDGVLDQSLPERKILGRLTLTWDFTLYPHSPRYRPILLPPNASIIQAYDNAHGELLILGAPGSGKTTLFLLVLARELLDRAQKDETNPMPIVFSLSSWAIKQQPLAEWLVEELNTRYQVPHHLSEEWVKTDLVIPLLDGLDEVASSRRAACINAINAFRKANFVPIVVCSRTEEYSAQHARLELLAPSSYSRCKKSKSMMHLEQRNSRHYAAEIQMLITSYQHWLTRH